MTPRARARAVLRRGLRTMRLSGPLEEVSGAARAALDAGVARVEILRLIRACGTEGTSGPSSRPSSPSDEEPGDARS